VDQDGAVERCVGVLETFPTLYGEAYAARVAAKLGLPPGLDPQLRTGLVGDLLALLQGARADHTGFFRDLARELRAVGGDQGTPARDRVLDLPAYDDWAARWRALGPDPDAMDAVNPAYVPRNHLLQAALDAADAGDLAPFERMLEVVTHPFTERPEWAEYALPDPAGGPFVTYCGT
jgi:serine/tyrosine/threonine adenylyltransferase